MSKQREILRFFYANRRARRQAFENGREIQFAAERWAVSGLLFILFVLPFLVNPSLLFQPAAWLWWARGCAGLAVALCVGIYAAAHFWHLPAQLTGATVDAMQLTGPEGGKPVAFPDEQVELPCSLPSQRVVAIELQVSARVRQLARQMRKLPPQTRTVLYPYRHSRISPLPTLAQKPSA